MSPGAERRKQCEAGTFLSASDTPSRMKGPASMTDAVAQREESHTRLNRSDAWLLAALTEGSHDGRAVTLQDFVHDADWLNRQIPTFDEMSYGVPRLIEAGFMTVGQDVKKGIVFRATPKATQLRKSVKAGTLGGVLEGVGNAVGTLPYRGPEPPEDRSLGRLAGLEPDDLDAAIEAHGAWVDRWSRPFVAAAQALTKWQNRNRS
jgi:hypothetical protein